MNKGHFSGIATLFLILSDLVFAARTVTPKEVGLLFQSPNGFTTADAGAVVIPASEALPLMASDALTVTHGRFHIFMPADQTTWAWFPYDNFKLFEQQQAAAGLPLFVTATYAGKKRSVYFGPSMGLDGNNRPTIPQSQWRQLVNVADPIFIQYWIDQYVRPIAWKKASGASHLWMGFDECYFLWVNFGVVDDNGIFINTLTSFDVPFPQNENDFLTMLKNFFHQLKTMAPDIPVMPNLASNLSDRVLTDPTTFDALYSDVPGLMLENIYSPVALDYSRAQFYQNLLNIYTFGTQGKVALLRANFASGDTVGSRTSLMIYLMMRGDNFFYAPNLGLEPSTNVTAQNPTDYMPMRTALGDPSGPLLSTQENGKGIGNRLLWRACQKGIAYLNWTGVTKTVILPTGTTYKDRNGNGVSSLTLADMTGDYVTTATASTLTCDINSDQTIDVRDVQSAVNQALGVTPCGTANIRNLQPPQCTVVEIQRIANAVLGLPCQTGP